MKRPSAAFALPVLIFAVFACAPGRRGGDPDGGDQGGNDSGGAGGGGSGGAGAGGGSGGKGGGPASCPGGVCIEDCAKPGMAGVLGCRFYAVDLDTVDSHDGLTFVVAVGNPSMTDTATPRSRGSPAVRGRP